MVDQPVDRRSLIKYGGFATVATLAGCLGENGDDYEGDGNGNGNGETDTDSPDTLLYTSEASLETLDPRNITQTSNHAWKFLAYNSLLKYTYDDDQDEVVLTGDLAEDWEWVDEDGETILQFEIRDGVEFQNGDTVNADILADEVNYWLDPDTESAQGQQTFAAGGLERASVDNDSVLNFHLEDLWAPLEEYIAYYMTLANPNVRDEMGAQDFGTEGSPGGSGPYEIVEWEEDNRVVLERFDGYYEEGLPQFERAEVAILPEQSTRTARLQSGDLHVDTFLDAATMQSFEDDENVETSTTPSPMFLFTALNHDLEPVSDNRVRRALRMAVDAEALINTAYEGLGQPTSLVNLPGEWWFWDDLDSMNQYDPEGAQELLDDAGYGDGFEIEMHAATLDTYQTMAQVLQSMWGEIGVDVELRNSEYSAMFGDIAEGNFETNVGEYRNDNDPDNMAWQSVHVDGRWANFSKGWAEQEPDLYDEYIESMREGRRSDDPEARHEAYYRAYEIFAEEMPLLVYGVVDSMMAYRTEITDFWHHPRAEVAGEALRDVGWE